MAGRGVVRSRTHAAWAVERLEVSAIVFPAVVHIYILVFFFKHAMHRVPNFDLDLLDDALAAVFASLSSYRPAAQIALSLLAGSTASSGQVHQEQLGVYSTHCFLSCCHFSMSSFFFCLFPSIPVRFLFPAPRSGNSQPRRGHVSPQEGHLAHDRCDGQVTRGIYTFYLVATTSPSEGDCFL